MGEEIIADLTLELKNDDNFNADVLASKVRSAIREVRQKRNYPSYYTEQMIDTDLSRYFTTIRNIALYDYNQYGAEFETSHDENGIDRSFVEREKLFSGVLPLARF